MRYVHVRHTIHTHTQTERYLIFPLSPPNASHARSELPQVRFFRARTQEEMARERKGGREQVSLPFALLREKARVKCFAF